jgi:UDP-N-acetyl-2-amino-2-deoxyglucuronate dehydrogenase
MNCAIVGCGAIAYMHAKVLQSLNDCNLIAVADIKLEKAVELAKEFGSTDCKTYSSLEEMLQKEQIDVLHICTPHYLHVPMAIYAMEHGIHVFMEKPPAISREQFKLLEKANKKELLGICFQNRYNESVKAVKDMLADPNTGKIKGARAFVTWNRSKEYYDESGWRGNLNTEGGGALINQSIHTLDLLVQFVGKPIWTESTMKNHHLKNTIQVEDTVEAYMEFEKGPVLFYATTAYSSNSPVFIELECENVTIRMEDSFVTRIYPDGHRENLEFYKSFTIGKDYWGTGHTACIKDYYNCINNHEMFPIGLEQVKDTFTLMMDIYDSARENKQILFDKSVKLSGFADEIDADFDKQIEVLHECNISYMELRSAYGKNISEYTLEEARELKAKLDKEKIKVSAIGSPIGKVSILDNFEEHFKLFCHVVDLAKLFDTEYIRIFSFYIPKDKIAENYKMLVIENLRRMIYYAKDHGIILLHENEKGIYGDNAIRCKELMDALYCENFKAIFDFANFVQCNQNTLEAFKILRPYIAYIHIKDAKKDSSLVVPAGLGDGHIARIVRILDTEKFDGFFSIEPHLMEFVGLKDLEKEDEKSNIGNEINDGRSAFITAYKAFVELLPKR